jgi:hypothetical protein
MPKTLDPNHLALMTAVKDAVDDLRKIYTSLDARREEGQMPSGEDLFRLRSVIDRLRLTLKGRIGS